MQNLIRQHRVIIGSIIFIFIGVPMLFWGVPGMMPGDIPQDGAIATVGAVPIQGSDFRQQLQTAAQQQAQGGERPTFEELDRNGTAERVLQDMVDYALLTNLALQRGFTVTDEFLEARMREWQIFQDDAGNFNPRAWNEWVQQNRESNRDWNLIYDAMRKDIAMSMYLGTQLASSARVLDSEIESQLEEQHTKMSVKFLKLEPTVTPTEEQIQAQYDENKENYRKPATLTAEYAAVSLKPELNEEILSIHQRASAGEDFAELANEVSDITTGNGGEIAGWQVQRERESEHRLPMFGLNPGEISEIVIGPSGFYIYKIDEERNNEETGQREVKARQIYKQAVLTPDERAARDNLAQAIADAANEQESLAAAAQESGLEARTTPPFASDALEIEGVPAIDVRALRTALTEQTQDEGYAPIPCQTAIYVARVSERAEGEIPPLDEVREQVTQDASNKLKGEEDYQAVVEDYATKIAAIDGSLDAVPTVFPELNAEIKSTDEFSTRDFLFQQQIFANTADIFEAFKESEPGEVAGPIQGMLNDTYFFELISLTKPTEEDREGWDDERENLRLQAMRRSESEQFADLRKFVRERLLGTINITLNQQMLDNILGRDSTSRDIPMEEMPVETAPDADSSTGAK